MRRIHLGMSACDCAKLEPFREISSDCHGRLARLGGCSGQARFSAKPANIAISFPAFQLPRVQACFDKFVCLCERQTA